MVKKYSFCLIHLTLGLQGQEQTAANFPFLAVFNSSLAKPWSQKVQSFVKNEYYYQKLKVILLFLYNNPLTTQPLF